MTGFSLSTHHLQILAESLWFLFLSSFNQLCLPMYDSYEELHKMLKLAISEGSEGFGMLWLPVFGPTSTRADCCTFLGSLSLHSSPFNSGLLRRESPRLWTDSLAGREGIAGGPKRLSWKQASVKQSLLLLYVYKISVFVQNKWKWNCWKMWCLGYLYFVMLKCA